MFTYLIPHAASEELFDICKDAISRYTPGNILVAGRDITGNWGEAIKYLIDNCPTDIAVFMDDDCILTKDITPLIEYVKNGEYEMVGIEGVVPTPDGSFLRYSPGYYDMTFMVINLKKFKEEFGEGYYTDIEQAQREIPKDRSIERYYGISQKLRGRKILGLEVKNTEYGLATTYGDYMIHLWYGSWKHRGAINDGISAEEFEARERKFIKDYKDGKITSGVR